MAHEESPVDWGDLDEAGASGQLMDLLVKLPRERWAERDEYGYTLLHRACYGPNVAAVVALLQSGLVDVNARVWLGNTPARSAVANAQPRVLEVLCAAGADLRARSEDGQCPIDVALRSKQNVSAHVLANGVRLSTVDKHYRRYDACVRVLVANGVRLSTVREVYGHYITPELVAFERGVLRCRAVVVAMLRVKRASGQLVHWDKFLLLEIAVCIWSTRYAKEWQLN